MKEIPYQLIFNSLLEIMPEEWHKIVFYAEYGASSYSMKYYVDLGNGKFIDCFSLKNISEESVFNVFSYINTQITPVRKGHSKKDTWTVMTLIVDNSGHFKADFEYADISEQYFEYFDRWKKKYLN